MKKHLSLFSFILAAVMLLSVSVCSFAAETEDAKAVADTGADGREASDIGAAESVVATGEAAKNPVITSAVDTAQGIKITWNMPEGVSSAALYRKPNGGSWTRIATTSDTSFIDTGATGYGIFTYTMRSLNASGGFMYDDYDRTGVTVKRLEAPVFSVANASNCVKISWNAVEGADAYRVYYYGSRGWTKLTDTTETSVLDCKVSSGYTYTYTVRCINADGTAFTSGYLEGRSVHYIAAPVISGMTNTETGVKLSWDAVKGAVKYRVYYYGRNGWTRMADTTATSYLDNDVSSGYTYTYTVRCINSDGTAFTSWFNDGVKHMFLAPPSFRVGYAPDGVTVSWPAVRGAVNYRVYRYGANGWAKLTDTPETSVTDKDVVSGITYKYTVRCLSADGTKPVSDYFAGKSLKYMPAPKISRIENTKTGVSLEWNTVAGAAKYRVYHRAAGGSWTRLADTSANTYTDTSAVSGTSYDYTVRCINAAGSSFESGYYEDGASILCLASPGNIRAVCSGNGIKVSWDAVRGAVKYRVYYYGRKGWTKLCDTAETSTIDTDVASGYVYRYTVRCVSADGANTLSDFDSVGASCDYHTVPALNALENTKDGVHISWKASKGAAKYRVYYYGRNGWTKLTETTGTEVTDSDVSSGHNYRYTVRCISADGKSFTSDFDHDGKKIYYVAAPKLVGSEIAARHITFTWSKSAGAAKYRVYKKVNGSWKRLAETDSNTYTDRDVRFGGTYVYTVRCLNSASDFVSGFDPEGFILTISGDAFVYYNQGDYDYPYGDDTIAYSGCGPTCFAMVASTLLGKTVTPIDAVKWCGNDYYMPNVGTYWSYFEAASNHFGVKLEGDSENIDDAIAALKKGKYVISSHKAGRFTTVGHFIVLAGLDANGKIIVYDPNGGNHFVGVSFTRDEINESGTHYWYFDEK